MYTLRFDGLFKSISGFHKSGSKVGFMGYGWLLYKNGSLIASGHGVIARGKEATSLNAEYLALIEGLEAMLDLGVEKEPIRILGDARCVIEQMRGLAAVNARGMKPLHRRAKQMAGQFHNIEWGWTPREYNRAADQLTRRALAEVRFDKDNYRAAVKAIDPRNRSKGRKDEFLSLVDLRIFQPGRLLPR